MRFYVPQAVFAETFECLRRCGNGRRECQALWISGWDSPADITQMVHPRHSASPVGFEIDNDWFGSFWKHLHDVNAGVRVQVHTHPDAAFHSAVDDAYPVIDQPGFLSLVIPNFAQGPVGFKGAFLAEIGPDGVWHKVPIEDRLEIV